MTTLLSLLKTNILNAEINIFCKLILSFLTPLYKYHKFGLWGSLKLPVGLKIKPLCLRLYFDLSTLYNLLFRMKVLCAAFMYYQFVFVFIWQKEICKKSASKMLVKIFIHPLCFRQGVTNILTRCANREAFSVITKKTGACKTLLVPLIAIRFKSKA